MATSNRKTNEKRSAEQTKWGEYLRHIKALPFVDKDKRVSWWAIPKHEGYPAPAMPYLRDDHNLDDASIVQEAAIGPLRNQDELSKAVIRLARLNRARWIKIEKRYTPRGANHIQVNSMLLVAGAS